MDETVGHPKLLADGKGVTARWGLKEALGKPASRRTEISYKAGSPGRVRLPARCLEPQRSPGR